MLGVVIIWIQNIRTYYKFYCEEICHNIIWITEHRKIASLLKLTFLLVMFWREKGMLWKIPTREFEPDL